jgi:diguanylate cyclase (GGDEF)-like protein
MDLRHDAAGGAQAQGVHMNAARRTGLPNFLPEDYLALLRAAVTLAWMAIFGMSLVKTAYHLAGLAWPELGGFALTYNLILAEFTLTAATLSVLAVRRDWFERVPRAASQKLRALLMLVVVWLAVHLFGAFHLVGALHGPLLPLLPVLIVAAFLSLPREGAWAAVALLVAGHFGVLVLEERHWLVTPGALAPVFSVDGAAGTGLLLVVLALTFALGLIARRRLDQAGANLNRGSRLNPLTGLFEQDFLMARLAAELRRARRHGGTVTLMLIEFDGFAAYTAQQGYIVGREALRHAGQVLIENTRHDMDTPARLAPTTFALLLPDARSDQTGEISTRIGAAMAQVSQGALRPRAGVASVAQAEGVTPEAVVAAASKALQQARPGAPPAHVAVPPGA